MTTVRDYYVDTQQLISKATVVDVAVVDEMYRIKLDKTIFHPQGGGQPSDSGTINQLSLIKAVNTTEGDVAHIVDAKQFVDCPLSLGEEVVLRVDAEKRFKHAALHTTGHLLHHLLMSDSKYRFLLSNPRGHHFPGEAKLIYCVKNSHAIDLQEIKQFMLTGIKQLIKKSLAINSYYLDNKKRMIKVGDYSAEACGGTHLCSTSFLQESGVAIKKITIKKGKMTVYYDSEASHHLLTEKNKKPTKLVEVSNLSKCYKNNIKVLKSVDLTINKGEIIGIIGRSGAGKSSLIRCINQLLQPTFGRVVVDQHSLVSLSERQLRQHRQKIGMIFQHFNLLESRTVLGNVLFPLEVMGWDKKAAHQRAKELLAMVELQGKEAAYPQQLSGGEKQRVAIARSIANSPQILLSDEATSALDPETTVCIQQLLQKINKEMGLTIILVTHEMDMLKKICHRVALLEKGELIEEAPLLSFFSKPQHAMAKQFVYTAEHADLLVGLKGRLKKDIHANHVPLIRLSKVGKKAISFDFNRLAKDFDMKVDLLQATQEWVGGDMLTIYFVIFKGKIKAIRQILDRINTMCFHVDIMGYLPADLTCAAAQGGKRFKF